MIKYVLIVMDNKRTMDEYTSEICMGGHNTIVMHNTFEVNHLRVKESKQMIANPVLSTCIIVLESVSDTLPVCLVGQYLVIFIYECIFYCYILNFVLNI